MRIRHSLFAQVYVTLLGVLALFACLLALAWWGVRYTDLAERGRVERLAWDLRDAIDARADGERLQTIVERFAARDGESVTVFGRGGRVVASVGRALPAPRGRRPRAHGWHGRRGVGPVFYLPLERPLWLAVRAKRQPLVPLLGALGLLAVAVALGSWPLAQRMTRRLTRLRAQAQSLGRGDLGARIEVEGHDEVAALARSFNEAATRIEALVAAQRETLAAASHELRTPLARLRLATEMVENAPEALRRQMAEDVDQLDALIEELLLVSRLRSTDATTHAEPVDLLALVAEESARFEVEFEGEPVEVLGEAHLLRRALRNLLGNAAKHAPGAHVQVALRRHAATAELPAGAVLTVRDDGPGIAPADRERLFGQFERGCDATGPRGAGLGLWLVRQIAERHGGYARHADGDAGGTAIELFLPLGR